MAVSDACVALLTALANYDVVAGGMDAEGYAITLQGLAAMEDDGWEFEPPSDEAQVTDAEKVEATCGLLDDLAMGLRSRRRYTVQVMPDGVEIIEVESGDLVQKIALSEVSRG